MACRYDRSWPTAAPGCHVRDRTAAAPTDHDRGSRTSAQSSDDLEIEITAGRSRRPASAGKVEAGDHLGRPLPHDPLTGPAGRLAALGAPLRARVPRPR